MSKSYVRYDCPSSSVIDYASYQPADELLNIKFKNGGVYTYRGVSKNRFTRLCKSDSIGSYFHEFVKGKYPVIGPRNFELERTLNQQLLDNEVLVASSPSVDVTVRPSTEVFVNGSCVLLGIVGDGYGDFTEVVVDAERVSL